MQLYSIFKFNNRWPQLFVCHRTTPLNMPSTYFPVVLDCDSPVRFLQYMLRQNSKPSTVVVCSTREEFLKDILSECRADAGCSSIGRHPDSVYQHPLLIPTIRLLNSSKSMSLAFVPSLAHLRAYLGIYAPITDSANENDPYDKPGTKGPILAVVNALRLHRNTCDFSAQGLSRTFAAAVDVATGNHMRLIVLEFLVAANKTQHSEPTDDNVTHESVWGEKIPLLNGSLRLEDQHRAWIGRTVEARQVLEQWCKFESLE